MVRSVFIRASCFVLRASWFKTIEARCTAHDARNVPDTKFCITAKKLISLAMIFFLSSCVDNWQKPYGYFLFRQMPKGGTPGYELGWKHGCESGLGSQFGGGIYMYFYTWKRDVDITSSNPDIEKIRRRYKKELVKINWNNPMDIKKNFNDYNTIFWGAHAFCRHSVVGILQTTGSGTEGTGLIPTIAGNERYDPAQDSLGRVWMMHGKGDTRWGTGFW